MQWINDNLKDQIDFIVWTGDTARHDNDESIPRNEYQVLDQNGFVLNKMREVFGKSGSNSQNAFEIPIVPTFGNNDILPHNIFSPGPNKWTARYERLWKPLVPEDQRHQFERGGWFYVEVIPNRLAVFSLNSLYFFVNNAAVDGCKSPSEPGFEHFEWLRIQLEFLRRRGMKAIISGHVPPARNDQKVHWDESCWQKYALWMQRYRDVIVGSLWGHMNIEHFMLQDFADIKKKTLRGRSVSSVDQSFLETADTNVSVKVKPPAYLTSLRSQWSKLPKEPKRSLKGHDFETDASGSRHAKYEKEIGGEWAERYALSLVSASVVPNFFPTLRVFEYNTTGLDDATFNAGFERYDEPSADLETLLEDEERRTQAEEEAFDSDLSASKRKHRKKKHSKKKHKKRPKKPRFAVPLPPSKSAPPGPAYSPQSLSLLGYTQYFANLTYINADDVDDLSSDVSDSKKKKEHRPFAFEVEYNTRNHSDVYELAEEGLTVRSFVRLAGRIGRYDPDKEDKMGNEAVPLSVEETIDDVEADEAIGEEDASPSKKKKKHKKRRIINKTWFAFVDRAVVRTMSREELHEQFGEEIDDD